ncbi:MAG: hypothetical protein BJ554DRAFT_2804 [Olpidium bornovanus]|uniref:CAP-Gly domain-containing protein n=1 Tax=Olpidium bornovanus TaxID=278681 RepID=A0A8H8DG51_9FUNG|nr:MAG: hypothetical protein BJ554DRAFT_2804 [Olpidium bornovanus]
MDSPRTPRATRPAVPDHVLVEGARVQLSTSKGTVRYVGLTTFATGKWVGIELDEPYFTCVEQFGVFVRPSQIKAVIGPDGAPVRTVALNRGRRERPVVAWGTLTFAPTPPPLSYPTPPLQIATQTPTASAAASPILTRSALPTAAAHDTSRRRSVGLQRPQSARSETPPAPARSTTSPPTSEETKPSPPASRLRSAGAKRPTTPTRPPVSGGAAIPKPASRATPAGFRRPEGADSAAGADSEEAQGVGTGATEHEYAEALQQKLREANMALEEAKAREQEYDEKYADLMDKLEMTTLDKEMAEEKIENLKLEVDALKDRVNELDLDLEVYKTEGGTRMGSSAGQV